MSIEIQQRKGTPWVVRWLAALVCVSALAGNASAQASGSANAQVSSASAQVSSASAQANGSANAAGGSERSAGNTVNKAAEQTRTSKPDSVHQGRANDSATLKTDVAITRWLARGAAMIAFLASALGLWWLSARWLRYRLLQWLALIALPSLIALSIFWGSQGSVEHRLSDLTQDKLSSAKKDPKVSAKGENVEALDHALALRKAHEADRLLPTLALRPTLEIAGGALLLSLLLWQLTHRRALQAT